MEMRCTLFKGGTKEHQVDLATYTFPDLAALVLMAVPGDVGLSLGHLGAAMDALLGALQAGEPLPDQLFVPDLWKFRSAFAHGDGTEAFEACAVAHGIATHCYQTTRYARDIFGTPGRVFSGPRA